MTMPKGNYYVGDLCYVMHDEWDEVCDLTISGREVLNGEFTLKDGRRFAVYSTKWGDGTYESSVGTSHSVDAGLIGCILVDDIRDNTYDDILSLGAYIEFNEDFDTGENDGLIHFGNVYINTDDTYENEYEYAEDELGEGEF